MLTAIDPWDAQQTALIGLRIVHAVDGHACTLELAFLLTTRAITMASTQERDRILAAHLGLMTGGARKGRHAAHALTARLQNEKRLAGYKPLTVCLFGGEPGTR